MRRFCQFGKNQPQEKCNHSIGTVAPSGVPALRDFFVNYEHMAHSYLFPNEHVANSCVILSPGTLEMGSGIASPPRQANHVLTNPAPIAEMELRPDPTRTGPAETPR
jgi:hypothetical protein